MSTKQNEVTTHLTLANACELAVSVLTAIVGEEVSSQLQGTDMYGSALCETVVAKLQSEYSHLIN